MCCNLPDAEDMHHQPECTSIRGGGIDEQEKPYIDGVKARCREVHSPHDAV